MTRERASSDWRSADTVLVSGVSEAPKGYPTKEFHRAISAVLVVDRRTHTVVDADVTFISRVAAQFVRNLLVGHQLTQGIDDLAALLRDRLYIPSTEATVQAIRAAVDRYWARKTAE